MLNEKQAKLMKLAIEMGCITLLDIDENKIDIKIKDMIFDSSQKTLDVGEDDIKFASFNLCYKNSENIDEKDVLHFYVKVFKNHGESDWFSIAGKFKHDIYIDVMVRSSRGASDKPYHVCIDKHSLKLLKQGIR